MLTLALVIGGVLLALPEETPPTQRPNTVRPVAASVCADVRLVVVDGNATGVAPVLKPLVSTIRARVRALGRSMTVTHASGDFPPASSMVPRQGWNRPVTTVVSKTRARVWSADVPQTVSEVLASLRAAAAQCPEQQLVLAGFGQGASVAHRVLARLSSDTVIRPRIVAAALVADPDRRAGTTAALSGNPTAPRAGQGVLAWRTAGTADVPDGGQPVLVQHACSRADVVCDPRATSFLKALSVYRGYSTAEGAALVRAVAGRVADRVALWPLATPRDQVVTVDSGASFSFRLDAGVADTVRSTVQWQDVAAVPAGAAFTPDGVLSGAVSKPGAYRITYRVRNTLPLTAASTGAITLVVRPTARGQSAGGRTSCETRSDGSAYCWGENTYGQLGDGTNVLKKEPTRVVGDQSWKQVSTGGAATCGISQQGELYCWGLNNRGQLGLGGGPQRWTPQRVGTLSTWDTVAVGWMHACATRTDGTLWCWGGNDQGQLGIGVGVDRSAPTQVAGTNWKRLAVGGWHTCATTTSDVASCWGRNDLGQLGTGNLTRRGVPTPVAGGVAFTELDASWSGTCALARDTTAWCWGMNDQGQVGDGSRTLRTAPRAVAGGRSFATVAVGDSHACGVDLEGSAWCWGSNRYGQLGDATTTTRRTPTRVAGDERWTAIDSGWMHTCGLSIDARTLCWGNNETGQLGYGDTVNRVAVPGVRPRLERQRAVLATNAVVTTFNILGTNHTEPGGMAPDYAPGRLRSEWAVNLLESYGSHLVGFQEMTLDQRRVVQKSMGQRFGFYPPISAGQRPVWQTVGWDKSQWRFVSGRLVNIPFRGKTRPNPIVVLENRFTGRQTFLFNIHNSAKNTPERERERQLAVRIEIDQVNAERAKPIEGILLGDFNAKDKAFCPIVGKTDLEAVNGGSVVGSTCTPPRFPRIDWIFFSPGFGLVDHEFEKSGRVRRVTDHSVLRSRLRVPGV